MILSDLDYRILDVVERHGKEISMAELTKFFPNQEILYNLQTLSKREIKMSPESKIPVSWINSAYLDERLKPAPSILGLKTEEQFYSITHKGQAALQNYRIEQQRILRAQKEAKKITQTDNLFYSILGAILGAVLGTILSKIVG